MTLDLPRIMESLAKKGNISDFEIKPMIQRANDGSDKPQSVNQLVAATNDLLNEGGH